MRKCPPCIWNPSPVAYLASLIFTTWENPFRHGARQQRTDNSCVLLWAMKPNYIWRWLFSLGCWQLWMVTRTDSYLAMQAGIQLFNRPLPLCFTCLLLDSKYGALLCKMRSQWVFWEICLLELDENQYHSHTCTVNMKLQLAALLSLA